MGRLRNPAPCSRRGSSASGPLGKFVNPGTPGARVRLRSRPPEAAAHVQRGTWIDPRLLRWQDGRTHGGLAHRREGINA